MFEVLQTPVFQSWFEALRDGLAQKRILVRIGRLERGNFGDTKSVGGGVSELRLPHGPGYRLYYAMRGEEIVLLLCGGDKSSQSRDIRRAHEMLTELE